MRRCTVRNWKMWEKVDELELERCAMWTEQKKRVKIKSSWLVDSLSLGFFSSAIVQLDCRRIMCYVVQHWIPISLSLTLFSAVVEKQEVVQVRWNICGVFDLIAIASWSMIQLADHAVRREVTPLLVVKTLTIFFSLTQSIIRRCTRENRAFEYAINIERNWFISIWKMTFAMNFHNFISDRGALESMRRHRKSMWSSLAASLGDLCTWKTYKYPDLARVKSLSIAQPLIFEISGCAHLGWLAHAGLHRCTDERLWQWQQQQQQKN